MCSVTIRTSSGWNFKVKTDMLHLLLLCLVNCVCVSTAILAQCMRQLSYILELYSSNPNLTHSSASYHQTTKVVTVKLLWRRWFGKAEIKAAVGYTFNSICETTNTRSKTHSLLKKKIALLLLPIQSCLHSGKRITSEIEAKLQFEFYCHLSPYTWISILLFHWIMSSLSYITKAIQFFNTQFCLKYCPFRMYTTGFFNYNWIFEIPLC